MSKPHVFHLIKGLARGGAEVLLSETLRASKGAFRYSYGYFLRGNGDIEQELVRQGATVVCFGAESSSGIFSKLPAVVAHLRRVRPDLIHAHLPLAGVIGRLASRFLGIPLVYTEHNRGDLYHPATRLANGLTWRFQDQVVAVSREVKAAVQSKYGYAVPVQVIHNGIDLQKFKLIPGNRERIRKQLCIDEGNVVVGTVAVFREEKRLNLWLEIAHQLLQEQRNVTFLVVGYGPLEAELKNKAIALGIRDSVRFVGKQTDVRPFLQASDIYLMTSLSEGLPVALLEAMALGCVPISTAAGGIPEVISHKDNGLLVDVETTDMLVERVESVLHDKVERARLSKNARRTIEERFNIQGMLTEIEHLYSSCLDGPNRS